ncbi:MAG: D-glycero-beta-D-manno-heptose 1-phosphate adenylyltransferase [Planctomycetes bacterium]|nr:D-glycero-beta-D-manno-heptose 1-phosphate adenylyltransferase [Planctomycetota bacterium]
MFRHLIDLVGRLGHPRILVVGDLIYDRYVFGDAERISPEAPIQVLRVAHEESRLGGAGSVVAMLHALGAEPALFAVVGRDDAGRTVLAELKAAGAMTGGVLRAGDRPTSVKVRFVGRAQHRIPQQVLRVDWEEVRPLSRGDEERLLARVERAMPKADAVLLSDYNKGVLTSRLTEAVIRQARRRKVPVLVDPFKGTDYAKYRGATLLTPNRDETQTATGVRLEDEADMKRAAKALVDGLDLDALVITLDKQGMYVAARGEKPRMIPTRPREVYDNVGAGDMVIAVVALVVAGGGSYEEAVRLANVAGGLEVMKFGVQTVTRDEIIADLLGEARRSGDKVRSLENLLVDLGRHRALDETVVFTNGCFDLLHAGHIEFLDFAGRQGDVLVVGLNSDRSVRSIKGPERPICPEGQRARVLSAIEAIDYIVLFDDDTPQRLIEAVRPDVLVKGEDWRDKGVVGRRFVESHGGRVVLAPLVKGLSTTDIVNRIRRNSAGPNPPKGGTS